MWSLVIETGELKLANRAMVFLIMKMLGVLRMAMLVIGMENIMKVLNGIKPQEYPQEKKGPDPFYGSFCNHE